MLTTSARAALFFFVSGTALIAQESVYTEIDLEGECLIIEQAEQGDSIAFSCDDIPGYPVRIAESDLRQFTQFGIVSPENLRSQTFAPWNQGNRFWR